MAAARPRFLALAALLGTLALAAPALAMSDVAELDTADAADAGGGGVAPETAPGDTWYDAGCFGGSVTLPPDTTVLPETSSRGLVVPLVLAGTSASMAEAALTVVVQDALGAYVPGAFHVLGEPALLVWTAETPLGAGASYRVDVMLDQDALSGGCGDVSGVVQYRYRVSVRGDEAPPVPPSEVATELVLHTSSTTNCCSGSNLCEEITWTHPELLAGSSADPTLGAWQLYTFTFLVDGVLWREDRIAAQPGEWIERSMYVTDGLAHELCVEVGVADVFDESRTLGERQCHSWQGDAPGTAPLECPPEAPRPGADGYSDGGGFADAGGPGPGDGGAAAETRAGNDAAGSGAGRGDGDGAGCACASVVATRASQGTPLLALLALLGLGALVLRQRRGVRS